MKETTIPNEGRQNSNPYEMTGEYNINLLNRFVRVDIIKDYKDIIEARAPFAGAANSKTKNLDIAEFVDRYIDRTEEMNEFDEKPLKSTEKELLKLYILIALKTMPEEKVNFAVLCDILRLSLEMDIAESSRCSHFVLDDSKFNIPNFREFATECRSDSDEAKRLREITENKAFNTFVTKFLLHKLLPLFLVEAMGKAGTIQLEKKTDVSMYIDIIEYVSDIIRFADTISKSNRVDKADENRKTNEKEKNNKIKHDNCGGGCDGCNNCNN